MGVIGSIRVPFSNAQRSQPSLLFKDSLRIQFGVGSLENALIGVRSGTPTSATATSLTLSSEGQDRLFEHTKRYAEDVVLRPAVLSNNPTLIDRFGHTNSKHVNGTHMMNGGGNTDFNCHSPLAVLALPYGYE
jgi:succinyl-CoA:acetate CoA-transferase